jgi:alanyl-tRNA synthetase
MDASSLRRAFTGYFADRGHLVRPSASLIPDDPTLLFTVAGMVPFKPYFLGQETPPASRLVTVQKCVRAGGKHNDLDEIGRTSRHLTFFEMMGNFSFGDYFKEDAIPYAWEFVTEVLGLDVERLWVTVHLSDDEAERIWIDKVGLSPERVQRLDADNWWAAGDTGPCGPCSEIFYDKGPEFGADGGPAHGGEDRFIEIWNLVFMQHERDEAGDLHDLAAKGIDTGAGLERILTVLQNVDTVFEIDEMVPLVERAAELTGRTYGQDESTDLSLRILAEHARSTSMLVSDGVFPANEDRGYVLRRIIRRAVRHAYLLGVETLVMADLVDRVVEIMGGDYPDLVSNHQFIRGVIGSEEQSFRRTLAAGSAILDGELESLSAGQRLDGEVAFRLHDTYGFPLEVTQEILGERGVDLDLAGFEAAMQQQRDRARAAGLGGSGPANTERYKKLLDEFGETEFVRDADIATSRVLAVLEVEADETAREVFLQRTSFYAESGGQIGDTGVLRGPGGDVDVLDTTLALPGLTRHLVAAGPNLPEPGDEVDTVIDAERRNRIRKNHTATHILHWALREVLGEHVKQAGSHVAPDRLRFDFSHFEALTPEQILQIEELANSEILLNSGVDHSEMDMSEAQELGAIAFFGDKYGDRVRVLRAGSHSIELCGGTHVAALGDIGPIRVTSEGSIGSNLRRIEAVSGLGTVQRLHEFEEIVDNAADLLGVASDGVGDAIQKRLDEIKALKRDLKSVRKAAAGSQAKDMAQAAESGVVVARVDGIDRAEIKDLAVAIRDQGDVRAVVLGGSPEGGGVALVAAVTPDAGVEASALLADASKLVQGGGKPAPDLMMVGGRDVSSIDAALDAARQAAGI